MLTSPLQLNAYYLKEIRFALTDALKNKPTKEAQFDHPKIDIASDAVPDAGNPLKWRCEVTIKTKGASGNPRYRFLITYVGFFEVSARYPTDRVELLAKTNGPALLYSAAREAIVSLTGRSPYSAILLPSITFLSPPAEPATQKRAGRKKPKQKPRERESNHKRPS